MALSLIPRAQLMSDLLTIREKGIIFTLLEPHCKLIKTTVAQVFEAKDVQGVEPGWSCLGCGVVCLIEDEFIHSYFLRLYCVKRAKLLWEQELYIPFKYTAACTFFHTFPADGHQAGFNFANETEAEEFLFEVRSVQRKQEIMTSVTEMTESDQPDAEMKPVEHLNTEQDSPVDAPSTTPTTSLFKDLDPAMRRLLIRAKLTEQDLKNKDIAEAVDLIINKFGGLKSVQRELRNKGSVSQTLPRSAGASISQALKKGPLPPVPSIRDSIASQQTHGTDITDNSPHSPATVSIVQEGIRKTASFKHVGSPASEGQGDLILTALKEVFRQKQLLKENSIAD